MYRTCASPIIWSTPKPRERGSKQQHHVAYADRTVNLGRQADKKTIHDKLWSDWRTTLAFQDDLGNSHLARVGER